MCEYADREKAILEEVPYNWKKHALFDLPDMLGFLIKLVVVFFVANIFISATFEVVVAELPAFCEMLK
jgi:hypothetical protein